MVNLTVAEQFDSVGSVNTSSLYTERNISATICASKQSHRSLVRMFACAKRDEGGDTSEHAHLGGLPSCLAFREGTKAMTAIALSTETEVVLLLCDVVAYRCRRNRVSCPKARASPTTRRATRP
jgi:hypothetical protein